MGELRSAGKKVRLGLIPLPKIGDGKEKRIEETVQKDDSDSHPEERRLKSEEELANNFQNWD